MSLSVKNIICFSSPVLIQIPIMGRSFYGKKDHILDYLPYGYDTLSSIGRVAYHLHNYTGAVQYFEKA